MYGAEGSSSSLIFNECVAPLVDAIFHGYNATVLAYGQVRNVVYNRYISDVYVI